MPTVWLAVRRPDGNTVDVGYVDAVPPNGSNVVIGSESFTVEGSQWELRPNQGLPRVRVTLDLRTP